MSKEDSIRAVSRDRQLASLGDAFVNFVYSLALTEKEGKPHGVKVSDKILAQAFRLAGLRDYLGTRISRKDLANATESLLVYAYLGDLLTIDESVQILVQHPDALEGGLVDLIRLVAERVKEKSLPSGDP